MKTNTTLPLKTGGEKISLNYKIKDFIQSVQGSTIDWQERRLKEFIRSLITHTTEQTARKLKKLEIIERLVNEEMSNACYCSGELTCKVCDQFPAWKRMSMILSEPLEKEQ